MKKRLKAPSPATVISLVALFVALGGTSLAASGYVNGKHIKPHSIPKNRLTATAIKGLKGDRGPVGPQGAAGAPGPQGQQGAKGATGAIGPSNAYSIYNGSGVALGASYKTVASLTLAPGSYVVMGKVGYLYVPGGNGTSCELVDSKAGLIDIGTTSANATNLFSPMSLLGPLASSGSTVSLQCASNENDASAYESHLAAIKLGAVSGS